ncbi:ABC transporter substrate-binding protein [Niveibacterium umoris]|uniref:Ribose transport system substrate-binding protein n=1 Tax=Niveibacterium umoris TaxID=1193620 RepID=A0A840BPH7_9RHOO|nr:substrate-binding domain-containing protein [Niveibacterium umoris]MBB4014554.1 ribose transport system substrate-binding protein [Niveibacterium umoris]
MKFARNLVFGLSFAALPMLAPVAAAAEVAAPVKLVGVTTPSPSNPYFTAIIRAAEKRVRELNPNAKVLVSGAEFDAAAQIREMDRFIAAHVEVILIAAANPVELGPAVARARNAGIAVVAVDVDAEGADVMIQSDNVGAGASVCRELATRLQGKGRFIIQNGPQVSSVVDRVQGCRTALKEFPGVTLLTDEGDGLASPWGGRDVMAKHIDTYHQIDAVFTINDRQALGAEMAAQQAGLNQVLIGSVDGSPDIEAAMKRPGLIVASAAQVPAEMGRRGVDIGLALHEGKNVKRGRMLLDTRLVTRENIMQYRGWEAR